VAVVEEKKGSGRPAKPSVVPHLSAAERAERGRQARVKVPRSSHATFEPPSSRPDPIDLLEEQAASRVPELVPIRYGRMLTSAFAFYRGAALIMASDLANTPRSGITVQACGDAHLSNFGVFASAERSLVFDINDFDETLPGPWEWDVKRLAASIAIAGRERGFTDRERATAVLATVEAYRNEVRTLAALPELAVWYRRLDADQILKVAGTQITGKMAKRTKRMLAKARTEDSLRAFDKLTHLVDGEPRILSDPPVIVPIRELLPGEEGAELFDRFHELLRAYRRTLQSDRRRLLEQFRVVDVARKAVGVGSVGTRAWIVLFVGRDETDPLFLQAKEAQPSVLDRFVGKSSYRNDGERVVVGQHLMQATSDIFLGWERTTGIDGVRRDFYVRQLKDWKGSIDPEAVVPSGLAAYGRVCGWTLARAHARSGDRIALAAYLGAGVMFDRAIAAFAEAYADQNQRDFEALQRAVADGRVTARTGL
jgi:uncharacterized protein (DUF2252 family)